ncbi:integrase core domain-containing protein [Burkholderia glumae]|uniref:integrase core domain-containing protein n=1 Tax=Burkholderia glumae TaxID=337 RepID=UPI003B986B0A
MEDDRDRGTTRRRFGKRLLPKPDAAPAARNPAIAFEHYNEKHPHSALKYRSPRGAAP